MNEIIFNLINQFNGNWSKIYDSISNKQLPVVQTDIQTYVDIINSAIFITDDKYFDKFKKMYMPPFAIFYKGNINLLNHQVFSILGRINTNNIDELNFLLDTDMAICVSAINVSDKIVNELLKRNHNIILILEKPIDDNELDKYSNQDNIVLVSEYCTNVIEKDKEQFLERIIYALGDVLYLENKNDYNVKIIVKNYENEAKKCYVKTQKTDSALIDKLINTKLITPINSFNDIVQNYKS